MNTEQNSMANNPSQPDPVTKNQAGIVISSESGAPEEKNMPGSYPSSPKDTTGSGGYSATPETAWSNKSQRGEDFPLGSESSSKNATGESSNNDTGLIDQSTNGTDLVPEIQDAMQGRERPLDREDVWGAEKGAGKDF